MPDFKIFDKSTALTILKRAKNEFKLDEFIIKNELIGVGNNAINLSLMLFTCTCGNTVEYTIRVTNNSFDNELNQRVHDFIQIMMGEL